MRFFLIEVEIDPVADCPHSPSREHHFGRVELRYFGENQCKTPHKGPCQVQKTHQNLHIDTLRPVILKISLKLFTFPNHRIQQTSVNRQNESDKRETDPNDLLFGRANAVH